jgi:hypothetical protein
MMIAAEQKRRVNTFMKPQASIRSIEGVTSKIKENSLEANRKPVLELEDDLPARDVPELSREFVVGGGDTTVRACKLDCYPD